MPLEILSPLYERLPCQVRRSRDLHPGSLEFALHPLDRILEANGPACVLDHDGIEPMRPCVQGRVTHAVVVSQPNQENPPDPTLAQVAAEPRGGLVVVLKKR